MKRFKIKLKNGGYKMILNVEKPYIWLPVSKNAPERKLHFYIEGKKNPGD